MEGMGAFTVRVEADNGAATLEPDLAELPPARICSKAGNAKKPSIFMNEGRCRAEPAPIRINQN